MTISSEQKQFFCSINQLYARSEVPDLQLVVTKLGDDSLKIELTNLRFKQQRRRRLRSLFFLLSFYIGYCALSKIIFQSTQLMHRYIVLDLGFALYSLYTLYSLLCLVESEKCLFCTDFALQKQTERFPSRVSSLFVPAANIHDVVINEVIQRLDVHYLLIIRTKGTLFKRRPIITLFSNLRPSIGCLEEIYHHLNKVMKVNGGFRKS